MSLTHGIVPLGTNLIAVVLAVLSARLTSGIGRRRAVAAVVMTTLLVGGFAVGQGIGDWIEDPVRWQYYLEAVLPVFGVCLAMASTLPRRVLRFTGPASDDPWTGRLATLVGALVLVPLGIAAVALQVNATYDYYPTLASLTGDLGAPVRTLDDVRRQVSGHSDRPSRHHGQRPMLVHVPVPGTISHFDARRGYVWLPPAYFQPRHAPLPVLLLLHGVPGQPEDWTRTGDLVATATAYSKRHHGFGPIVVMPDINGSVLGDSECVDSPLGNVETYLTRDVPAFVHRTFPGQSHSRWSVAGLSEGGMCAAALALRHPDLFGTFGDFSGLPGPTVGNRMNPPATVKTYFAGSKDAYDQHTPVWLLTHRPTPDLRAVFVAGDKDRVPLLAQHRLTALTRARGLPTTTLVLHGNHNWNLWRVALRRTFSRLVPTADPHPSR